MQKFEEETNYFQGLCVFFEDETLVHTCTCSKIANFWPTNISDWHQCVHFCTKKFFISHFSMFFWKKMIIEPLIKVSCYFLEPRDCSEGKWLWWGLPRDPWSPAELCPAFRCHSGDVCIRLILVLIFDCEKMLTLGAF